jgi:hypothetical protein
LICGKLEKFHEFWQELVSADGKFVAYASYNFMGD